MRPLATMPKRGAFRAQSPLFSEPSPTTPYIPADKVRAMSTASASFTPPQSLGLRQRHPHQGGMVVNENSNPNGGGKLPNNDNSMMKFGGGGGGSGAAAETRRPPPPRASLTTSRPKFNRSSPSIIAPSQANTNTTSATETLANDASVSNRSALVLNVTDNSGAVDEKEEDLALWVVGYGYRNEAQFRILYHQLSACGNITSRIGGLSCFGESNSITDVVNNGDNTTNWVAVKYESPFHAHKALCLHATITNVHGSTVVMGVLSVADEPSRAIQFGIIGTSRTSSGDSTSTAMLSSTYKTTTMTKYNNPRYDLKTESDILLNERMTNHNSNVRSSMCGKILAWFFSWD